MRKRLEDMTKKELLDLARDKQVSGYSNMTKPELIKALEKAEKAERAKKPAAEAKQPAAAAKPPTPEAKKPAAAAKPPDLSIKDQVAAAAKAKKDSKRQGKDEPRAKAADIAETPPAKKQAEPAAATPKAGKDKAPQAKAETAKDKVTPEPTAQGKEPAAEVAEPEQELTVQAAKYQTRASGTHEMLIDEWAELPPVYGHNRITLMPVDPYRLHAYWELTPEAVKRARAQGGILPVLRLYDVTDVLFDGSNANSYFDIERGSVASSWYLDVPEPQRSYLVDLAYLRADGRLVVLARSNVVRTAAAAPSPVLEEHFTTIPYRVPISAIVPPADEAPPEPPAQDRHLPETGFPVLAPPPRVVAYQPVAAGAGAAPAPRPLPPPPRREPTYEYRQVQVGSEIWQLRFQVPGPHEELELGGASEAVSSWAVSSWAVSSWAMPVPPPAPPRERDFWLVADCHLVVYGATEPDATVTVQGRRVPLRPDGTFVLRYDLPDGLLHIPIHGTAVDGEQQRWLTIDVTRATSPVFSNED